VKRKSRVLASVTLSFLAMLALGSPAPGADYSIDVGIDSGIGRDAGTLACTIGETCNIRLLQLQISVHVSAKDPGRAEVRMSGYEPDCCYFEGAARTVLLDLRGTSLQLPIFRRQRARRDLFIENEFSIGTLYLRALPR
jgi:hypothetical protein